MSELKLKRQNSIEALELTYSDLDYREIFVFIGGPNPTKKPKIKIAGGVYFCLSRFTYVDSSDMGSHIVARVDATLNYSIIK